jgi:hypothetical protein
MNMRAAIVAGSSAIVCAAAIFACGSSETRETVGALDGGTPEGGLVRDGATPDRDASDATLDGDASESYCATRRAYDEACGLDPTCGVDHFDAWCAQNDAVINSDAFRRVEAKCLTSEYCNQAERRDCELRSYADETPTATQSAIVDAYCETCEPGNVAGCRVEQTTYDPNAGPTSVTDVFVAAWELSDALTAEIKTKCTGGALDAGSNCAKAFSNCAGGVYVDRLPDCPQ